MKKPITLIFVCLIFTTTLFAQKKIEEGFDAMFKPSTSGWRYYVSTEKKDGLWYREAYYIPEKGMAMMGLYKDKDCKIPEGKITWYYPNRNPKSSIGYKDGKEDGPSLRFHENGKLSDSSTYVNGHLTGASLGWDEEGNQVDSSNFDGNGNGVMAQWYANGAVYSTGRITNDTTRINRWTYYHENGKLMATVDYVNGKIVHCSCSDEMGVQLDSSLCVEKEASFPGEDKGWLSFMTRNLRVDVAVNNLAPIGTYTVLVQFVVDKEGHVTDIKPLTEFGFGMEEEVVRVLNKSPKWTPANQFGRKVKAYRKQPVSFIVEKS
jgi:hypothetical protein